MKKFKKIYIEITNICNLKCSFCSEVNRKKEYINVEVFEDIINKIKDYTDYVYLHVKGEPLLHPQIIDLINVCKKYNIKVNLTTNGTLFPEKVDKIKTCKNINKINFSLHSENNIDNYCEKIFESVEKLPDTVTVIYRLWTLKNNELDEKSTNIVEKISKYYNLSTETVEKIKKEKNIKIKSTIYVDKDNEFEWPNLNETNESLGYCYALKTQIAILVDGTVVPCCLDSDGIIKLGNIKEETMDDIINSNRFKELQQSFQQRRPNEELCKKCRFKDKFNK
jgi:radical SAM protein with 4Fe4S-binding SPASM domain